MTEKYVQCSSTVKTAFISSRSFVQSADVLTECDGLETENIV